MWLNPIRIARNASRAWQVLDGGGPRAVRVLGIDPPTGWLIPSSEIHLEVEAADGRKVDIDAALPLPPLYGWGYRAGRRLGLPVLSSIRPEDIRFGVPLPWGR
jgi:hypothetical protein